MISQKIKTNAAISYFFLGWIFLLASKNPNFQDPFIRHHAKVATKGHVLFFVGYILYSHFLSTLFLYTVPMIGISIDRIIDLGVFSVLTIFILFGAYRAGKGEEIAPEQGAFLDATKTVFEYSGASEADRVILLLSFIPLLGISIAKKHPSSITAIGSNTGLLFILCYGAYFVGFGFDALAMMVLFLYLLLLAFLAARFFFSNTCTLPGFFRRIPSIDTIYMTARTIPAYIKNIAEVAIGKKDSLDFLGMLETTRAADLKFYQSMREYFTDGILFFPTYLIFIPFVNSIFIPKLFLSRNTRYIIAIGQGLILTLLSLLIGIVYGFSSRMELLLVFPALLGMVTVGHDPFYRIPVIYEIYSLLNTVTF